jgi:Bifunctional DNA primase/polymerase, N-terminal
VTNIPHERAGGTDLARWIDSSLEYADAYIKLGWKVFLLGRAKTPLPNCRACNEQGYDHDREECECLTCHGFYAATNRLEDIERMLMLAPGGLLAVRTGTASGLLVIDAESSETIVRGREKADGESVITGLDVLDQWESWARGCGPLQPTLRQRTASGGVHLLYRLTGAEIVGARMSRNRVLPQVDVKANGGYVAVPTPGHARVWGLSGGSRPLELPADLATWLATRSTRGAGGQQVWKGNTSDAGSDRPEGYDFKRACETGARDGERDVFFRDLIYANRRAGVARDVVERLAKHHWEKCDQPPQAQWFMPWEHVQYKIENTWRNVAPELTTEQDEHRTRWATGLGKSGTSKVSGTGDGVDARKLRPGIQQVKR